MSIFDQSFVRATMKSRDEYETKRLRLNEVLVGVNIKANAIFRAGIPFQISFGFSFDDR